MGWRDSARARDLDTIEVATLDWCLQGGDVEWSPLAADWLGLGAAPPSMDRLPAALRDVTGAPGAIVSVELDGTAGRRLAVRGTITAAPDGALWAVTMVRDVSLDDVVALQRECDALERAQEVANVGSWSFEPATGVLMWSAQMYRIHGLDPARGPIPMDEARRFVHPDDAHVLAGLAERLLARRRAGPLDYRIVRPDGTIRHIVFHAVAEIDSSGSARFLLGTAMDVTERKRLEAALHHAQKLEDLGRMAGGIAHDFNNVLTAIAASAELAVLKAKEEPLARELRRLLGACESGARLVKQLLAFAQRKEMRADAVALGELLHGLEWMLRRLLGDRVDLTIAVPPAVWNVRADAGEVERVLVNLARNARDAMPQGGTLAIAVTNVTLGDDGAAPPGDYVRLDVTDTGSGMDEETLGHVFEPFFTTKPAGEGTGLGLATAYGVVRQWGGVIDVTSRPGEGTTFSLYFPRA